MLSVSPSMVARSSLEEMLESLRQREEKPRDAPPALPCRPTSRARLPKARRSVPVKSNVGPGKEETAAAKWEGDDNGGLSERGEGDSRRMGLGIKKRVKSEGESPYLVEKSDGLKSTSTAVAEWDNNIDYFIKMKLCVWCRLQTGQWELGRIQSTSGEEAHVQLLNGNAIKVATSDLLPANPDILEGVDDLIQLGYLNEPSVLHNLQFRYYCEMVYSKAGPVLIAVNPFKNVQIYGNNMITAYRQKLEDSPHVYALADAAYSEMITDGVNQSIIISGESGAGKTETAKIAMQYLTTLGGDGDGIEREVLQTSYVLEAFGNAKTSRNDNSSRFGKLIEIHFSTKGKICGAVIQTFLLEKSRVVQLSKGERSYHVFYQLCAGASSDLRGRLNIKMANDYNYLSQSDCLTINDVDDARKFHELQNALDVLRVLKEDQESMFTMLAAVLWLGNISFQVVDDENHVQVVPDEALVVTARLMGCSIQDLKSILSTRKIQAGKDRIAKSLTLQQATDTRDALAKLIYSSLFDWLVEQINKLIAVGKRKTGRSISILDIYGFESFQKNSFEQFCINYANERLQQHFNRHLFKLEQEDYDADGINWTKVEFKDNQECLNLIEKKPLGLLSLLDEESNFPKARDITFGNKLAQHLSSNPCFKGGRGGAFSVCHYAAEVCYDTSGFLEKNRDPLPSDSIQFLSSCDSRLLQSFASNMLNQSCKASSPTGQTGGSDAQKQSVATKFKGQLYRLMQRLEDTTPHFIRCIKPNSKQLPGVYENDLVLQQLRCCGVLEVVRIAKSGYPTRITHQEFANRYGFLLLDKNVSQDPLSISVAILQQFNILPEMYQVGYTKLFFRAGQIGALEDTKRQVVQSVVGVQSCYRRCKARRQFLETKTRVAVLQSFVRSENARRKYASLLKNQRADTHKHKHSDSDALEEQARAIIKLQSVIRQWLARRHFDQNSKKINVEMVNDCGESESELSVTEDLQPVDVQAANDVVEELQKRVAKAEETLGKQEEEKAELRSQLQEYERKWSEYEAKMKTMEEMWQKQVSFLQTSLAAAEESLSQQKTAVQHGRNDDVPSPLYHDSESNLSYESPMPGGSTPVKGSDPNADARVGREPNSGSLNPVTLLSKEFEQKRQGFDEDAKVLTDVRYIQSMSGTNSYEELRRLKLRFEVWKKEYKVRLRATKAMIMKLGHSGMGKRRRRWWGKISTRITHS